MSGSDDRPARGQRAEAALAWAAVGLTLACVVGAAILGPRTTGVLEPAELSIWMREGT